MQKLKKVLRDTYENNPFKCAKCTIINMKAEEFLRQLFNTLARRYGFNPLVLKEIIILNARGYNNLEIANMLGISRNTVAKYLKKLKYLDSPDFIRLVLFAILAHGGLYFLPKELQSESSEIYAG